MAAENRLADYDAYRKKIAKFSNKIFEDAPEPTPVIDTVIKLVTDENPKFSHPVGKGAPLILAMQHFSYKTFENSILKRIK